MIKKLCVVAVLTIMVLSFNPAEIQAIPKDRKIGTIEGLRLSLLLPAIQAAREAARVRASGSGEGVISVGNWSGEFQMQVDFYLLFSPLPGRSDDDYVVKGRWRSSSEYGGSPGNFRGNVRGNATYNGDEFSVNMTLRGKGRNGVELVLSLQGLFDITDLPGPVDLVGAGKIVFRPGKH